MIALDTNADEDESMLNGSIFTRLVALLVVADWSSTDDQSTEPNERSFLLVLHSAADYSFYPSDSLCCVASSEVPMADPITLLRQFVVDNKEYHLENDLYVFNDLAYPKDVKTNYLVYGFVHLSKFLSSLNSNNFQYRQRQHAEGLLHP